MDTALVEAYQRVETALRDFISGKVTLEQWLAMDPGDRGMMGGAIMGNYSSHHAKEAYELLRKLAAIKS